jgi:hypothetical protein
VSADVLQAAEFWELGLEPHPISAISGTGTGELLDAMVGTLPAPKGMEEEDEKEKPLAIAIVGRPNVGECGCRRMGVWWVGWGGGVTQTQAPSVQGAMLVSWALGREVSGIVEGAGCKHLLALSGRHRAAEWLGGGG